MRNVFPEDPAYAGGQGNDLCTGRSKILRNLHVVEEAMARVMLTPPVCHHEESHIREVGLCVIASPWNPGTVAPMMGGGARHLR